MTKNVLQNRFDSIGVQKLLRLWQRCCIGMNNFLRSTNGKTLWGCETVTIPFDSLESASLACLVSWGESPEESGNDILFLVINQIIAQFNAFADHLGQFTREGTMFDISPTLSARQIVRGLAGGLQVESLLPPSKEQLSLIIERSWLPERKEFDSGRLRADIERIINLWSQPVQIANPAETLRQKFVFRDDEACTPKELSNDSRIFEAGQGLYFARKQDAQLVGEVEERVEVLGNTVDEKSMCRSFMDGFHELNYDSIRAVLEGCCNFLDLLYNDGRSSFDSIKVVLEDITNSPPLSDPIDLPSDPLISLGFPNLSKKQLQFLQSLDSSQTVQFVRFAARQLATEAYVYSSLPFFTKEPLGADSEKQIQQGIQGLCTSADTGRVIAYIEEFEGSILQFYEKQIIEGASKLVSLRSFLKDSNFCDSSDPVFALLPPSVTVRNYVSLRQLLHESRLSLMHHLTAKEGDDDEQIAWDSESSSFVNSPGRCWLWENERQNPIDTDFTLDPTTEHEMNWKLWFEEARSSSFDAAVLQPKSEDFVDTVTDTSGSPRNLPDQDLVGSPKTKNTRDHHGVDNVSITEEGRMESGSTYSVESMDSESCSKSFFSACQYETEQTEFDTASISTFTFVSAFPKEAMETLGDRFGDPPPQSLGAQTNPRVNHAESEEVEVDPVEVNEREDLYRFLRDSRLPQKVENDLGLLGIRCVDDVFVAVEQYPDLLDSLPPLDKCKLMHAVAKLKAEGDDLM